MRTRRFAPLALWAALMLAFAPACDGGRTNDKPTADPNDTEAPLEDEAALLGGTPTNANALTSSSALTVRNGLTAGVGSIAQGVSSVDGIEILLLDADSGETIATATSDATGSFAFEATSDLFDAKNQAWSFGPAFRWNQRASAPADRASMAITSQTMEEERMGGYPRKVRCQCP